MALRGQPRTLWTFLTARTSAQRSALLSHRLRMREQTNMDAFEELLCDEVRRYPHLYNPSLQYYKDAQMTTNSWGEIARTLGKEEKVCRAKWKYLRDRFVKIKKNAPRHLSPTQLVNSVC